MIKNQVLDVLAWISLGIGVIFLVWYIFGDSPTEVYFLLPFVFTLIFKWGTVSNDIAYLKGDYSGFKENTKESFQKVKEDMGEIKADIKKILSKR